MDLTKTKLKQIVNSTIISSNEDTKLLLANMGKAFLNSASTMSLLDVAVAGYGFDYVVCNLLEYGRLWEGSNFNSQLSTDVVIGNDMIVKINKILDAVNLFCLHVHESYGDENLQSYLTKVLQNYQMLQKVKRISITDQTRSRLEEILREPVWNFLLVFSLFSSDFAGIPTRGESETIIQN